MKDAFDSSRQLSPDFLPQPGQAPAPAPAARHSPRASLRPYNGPGLFITGTGTDVGKTTVTARLRARSAGCICAWVCASPSRRVVQKIHNAEMTSSCR